MTAAPWHGIDPAPAEAVHRQHRVLFLADDLASDDAGGGGHGVTTYLKDVLPVLKALGNEIGACFLRHPNPAAVELRAAGVDVSFLATQRSDPFLVEQIDEIVRRGRYGILHCTQFRASIAARMLARRRSSLKIALHVHDMTMPSALSRWLHRMTARDEDLAICVSSAAADVAVRGYCVRPERVRVVHTGIVVEGFRPVGVEERAEARRELAISDNAPVLCLLGRFGRVKGNSDMIRMFSSILGRHPDAVLMLVGEGPERPARERLIAELGLEDRVRLLGVRHDVGRWLAAADVGVVPSSSEGLCRAAIEATLCGLPVVAFDVGGVRDVLPDAICGELVPRGDEAGFVAAIERALDGGVVPLGDARARWARERFGVEDHARTLVSCYDELE